MAGSRGEQNRPTGPWIGWLIGAGGLVVSLLGVTGRVSGGRFGAILVGAMFAGAGALIVVTHARDHGQAIPESTTRTLLIERGWTDLTDAVRADPRRQVPGPARHVLQLDAAGAGGAGWVAGGAGGGARGRSGAGLGYGRVAELAGIHPTSVHAAGALTTRVGEVRVAETWSVTSSSSTNGRVTGGTVEPRVVAWLPIPADIGRVTIRPDSARMKLADLVGVRPDHQVDWEAVDETWHLHGDDEPLLRAVVDIGLMGRLTELPGRWVVRFDGPFLLVVPTADRGRLAEKPPALVDVAGEIADVAVAVRSILPEMLWRDLDGFLAGWRG